MSSPATFPCTTLGKLEVHHSVCASSRSPSQHGCIIPSDSNCSCPLPCPLLIRYRPPSKAYRGGAEVSLISYSFSKNHFAQHLRIF